MAQLGQLASTHDAQCRQTLIGGYYELLDRATFAPNPDYWLAVIWKLVMGDRVVQATSSSPEVLTYAHCGTGGGVTLAFINTSPSVNFQVTLEGLPSSGVPPSAPRFEYILSTVGAPPEVGSKVVALNGAALAVGPGGVLPPLTPAKGQEQALQLPPQSWGFVSYPSGGAGVCA